MMKRLILYLLILLFILLQSCRKSENDFIWEKSYGKGAALFVVTSSDSGFAACGEMEGKPYFIRFDKNRQMIMDFNGENPGLYSSFWFDTSGYISGGNIEGKMLIMYHNPEGNMLWEKSIDAGYNIDYTSLLYSGNGEFLAIGSASPDLSDSGPAGLLFVRFDTTGQVLSQTNLEETNFISANKAAVDNGGNIYLALTRSATGSKPKASVAKYNDQFQKLWETDIFNNPNFAAASLAINLDESGIIYVTGKTELPVEGGILNNSFLVSLSNSGEMGWNEEKRYLENSNEGTAIIFNDAGELMMLNKNCFIINIINPADGTDAGRIRMFSLCDSYNTDAHGLDFGINYDKNILVAGDRGGNFYLAIKTSQ